MYFFTLFRTSPLTESIKKLTFPKKDIGVTSKTSGKDRKNSSTKGKKKPHKPNNLPIYYLKNCFLIIF